MADHYLWFTHTGNLLIESPRWIENADFFPREESELYKWQERQVKLANLINWIYFSDWKTNLPSNIQKQLRAYLFTSAFTTFFAIIYQSIFSSFFLSIRRYISRCRAMKGGWVCFLFSRESFLILWIVRCWTLFAYTNSQRPNWAHRKLNTNLFRWRLCPWLRGKYHIKTQRDVNKFESIILSPIKD